jgi:hypothetical protein
LEDYNPVDQLANLKAWWKQYGNALIVGIVIGLVLLAGGNYWKQYKIKRAEPPRSFMKPARRLAAGEVRRGEYGGREAHAGLCCDTLCRKIGVAHGASAF